MFTGIIEEVGTLKGIRHGQKSSVVTIGGKKLLIGTKIGDSISTNGVCLTVTKLHKDAFDADVMPETLQRSNLGGLQMGGRVNLERALQLDTRLGGHIVSGHIDGTGSIKEYRKDDNAVWITISAGPELLRYIIEKGSIAIDGVSRQRLVPGIHHSPYRSGDDPAREEIGRHGQSGVRHHRKIRGKTAGPEP